MDLNTFKKNRTDLSDEVRRKASCMRQHVGLSQTFRVASPWNLGIFNSSGHPGKQKTAILLVSVEEIEPQNIYFWR